MSDTTQTPRPIQAAESLAQDDLSSRWGRLYRMRDPDPDPEIADDWAERQWLEVLGWEEAR